MLNVNLDISVEEESWGDLLPDLEKQAPHLAQMLLAKTPFNDLDCEISLLLTNDAEIQVLNKNYRQKDKPTNVLSFPQYTPEDLANAPRPVMLGDIILAYETIKSEAAEHDKVLADHALHLIAHGLLHLLGYDHETEAEAEAMEALEIEVLQALNIKNPYEIRGFMQ